MGYQVLVTYATKHGATAEIAEEIGSALREAGLRTEVLPVRLVHDLMPYTAVVLGSAVYIGRWRKEAVRFLTDHEKELSAMPVWLFSSGPTGEGEPEELTEGWRLPEKLQPLVDRIKPREVAIFHGDVDMEELNVFERWIINKVTAPVGDFRDWEAIHTWAEKIAIELRT